MDKIGELDKNIAFDVQEGKGKTSLTLINQRYIDVDALVEKTLEAKYPEKYDQLKKDLLAEHTIALLTNESIPVIEAVKLLAETSKRFFADRNEEGIDWEKEYEAYEIDIPETIQRSVNAIKGVVRKMTLPTEVENGLLQYIDRVSVVFEGNNSFSYAYLDESTRETAIRIGPVQPIMMARELSEVIQDAVGGDVVKSFIIGLVGHEMGHAIDNYLGFHKGTQYASQRFSSTLPVDDFPIKYDDERGAQKQVAFAERFAYSFQRATIVEAGLSVEATDDYTRMKMSRIVHLLQNVSPSRLSEFQDALEKYEEEHSIVIRSPFGNEDTSGYEIGWSYPFTKEDIVKGILSPYEISGEEASSFFEAIRYFQDIIDDNEDPFLKASDEREKKKEDLEEMLEEAIRNGEEMRESEAIIISRH